MSSHLTKINKLQRVEMIEIGLNPLNPDHVDKYLRGGSVRANVRENEDRIKAVMGDKLGVSLGHGNERDLDPVPGADPNQFITKAPVSNNVQNVQNVRQQLSEEMDAYASSTGTMAPTGLMNIRESAPAQPKQQLNEVADRGKKLATNYYNAFIKSLQSPGTASNMAVYKSLKAMLEQEQKLQGSQYLGTYQKAVQSVTQQMYQQLKG